VLNGDDRVIFTRQFHTVAIFSNDMLLNVTNWLDVFHDVTYMQHIMKNPNSFNLHNSFALNGSFYLTSS